MPLASCVAEHAAEGRDARQGPCTHAVQVRTMHCAVPRARDVLLAFLFAGLSRCIECIPMNPPSDVSLSSWAYSYSAFVKANFSDVRKALGKSPHGDVMKALAARWALEKAAAGSSGSSAAATVEQTSITDAADQAHTDDGPREDDDLSLGVQRLRFI